MMTNGKISYVSVNQLTRSYRIQLIANCFLCATVALATKTSARTMHTSIRRKKSATRIIIVIDQTQRLRHHRRAQHLTQLHQHQSRQRAHPITPSNVRQTIQRM